MIISLSGRVGSGKTTLAKQLIKQGFTKIAFADCLKKYMAEIFNEDLNKYIVPKYKAEILNKPLIWNKKTCAKLAKLTGLNLVFSEFKSFSTRREAIQHIGAQVIRKHDIDFHVKKTIESLEKGIDYVFDDCRYPNELKALKQLKAIPIYILRPDNFEISNHDSEISLNWNDFNYHILNNDIKKSCNLIDKFIKVIYKEDFFSNRKELINILKENLFDLKKTAKKLKISEKVVRNKCNENLIYLSKNICELDNKAFLQTDKKSAYFAGLLSSDGCISNNRLSLTSTDLCLVEGFKKYLKTNKKIYIKIPKDKNHQIIYTCEINSPFILENLKYWNVKPRKSRYNELPDILKDKPELFKYWLLGLIDGDGSIYVSLDSIYVEILASKQIIDYVAELYKNIKSSIYQKGDVDNLYVLRFRGSNAMEFYKQVSDPIALKRKWNKLKKYV